MIVNFDGVCACGSAAATPVVLISDFSCIVPNSPGRYEHTVNWQLYAVYEIYYTVLHNNMYTVKIWCTKYICQSFNNGYYVLQSINNEMYQAYGTGE